ncbi:MAG: Flp pilus assembly complex ATPase component TadA [Bdellovibrionales bacterium]|nr:Flp pilus assembly complex ATPase component TadA [Bdellovibrionales bacterium]
MNAPNPNAPKAAVAAPSNGLTGHIIAVVGGKGGVGKSVFSANLALAMAADAKNGPAMIDCDPYGTGDVNLILGVKQAKGYGDQVLDGKVPDANALKQYMTSIAAGQPGALLYTLQLLSNPERLLAMDEDKVELAFKMMRRTFPVTIVDCGNRIDGAVLRILDLSSLILVVTNPEILVLNQTKKILDKLQTSLFPPDMTKIVLNRYPAGNPYNPQFIEQTLKRQVVAVIPEDTAAATAALSKGVPLVSAAPQSTATKALFQLSRTIIEKRMLETLSQAARPVRKEAAPEGGKVIPMAAPQGRSRFGKEPQDPRSILKLRVHAQLIDKMDLKKEQLDRALSPEKKAELREKALKIVTEILNREDHPWKARESFGPLVKEVLDEALALGPLEDLLADDEVKEVMVNRADLIYIEKGGRIQKSPVTFSSNVQLMSTIERIVNPLGRRIDEQSPYVDARLADGSRVHAIIPPLSIDGPMITIRKFPKVRPTPETLLKWNSMTPEMMDFLRACIEAKLNVVISGGTGSGKTTLLNVLSSFIPATERILTVEDAAELQLGQEHVGRLEARPPSIEGTGAVTIRDLVKQTLRMRPDRIIIGEVRDGAAMDMLQAMNTGHDGSMATVHSNNPRDAIGRLETLVMMAGMDLPAKAIREQIAGAVNLIVQASRLSDGSRKITHVTEISGMQGDVVTLQDIFVFRQQGLDANRKVIGKHVATGFIPKFIEKIEALGIKIPRGLFKAA